MEEIKKDEMGLPEQKDAFDIGDLLLLKLYEPYQFEGEEVTEINMEGMLGLTGGDLCLIDSQMNAKGYSGYKNEANKQYAMFVAARVNKKPAHYCNGMKARDVLRLRDMVTAFFYARA